MHDGVDVAEARLEVARPGARVRRVEQVDRARVGGVERREPLLRHVGRRDLRAGLGQRAHDVRPERAAGAGDRDDAPVQRAHAATGSGASFCCSEM